MRMSKTSETFDFLAKKKKNGIPTSAMLNKIVDSSVL